MDSSSNSVSLVEDLIVNILSRLPVKPLSRFKCVSNRWRSLISDPHFAKLHLQQSLKDDAPSCLRIIKSGSLQSIDPEAFDNGEDDGEEVYQAHSPGTNHEQWFSIIGSCNGLVCLGTEGDGYIVYNPTTREFRNIAAPTLVQDLEQNHFFRGLGYDPVRDDYKILLGLFNSNIVEMEIFSLKTNSWRRIEPNGVIVPYERGIYLNGALHWFVDHRDNNNNRNKNIIISFDLAEEKFKEELSLPDNLTDLEGLGIVGGHLFVHRSTWRFRSEAWVMKEYGNGDSWVELFNVDIATDGFPWSKYFTTPLTCTRSGKVVFDVDGRQMALLNPDDDTLKEFVIDDADYETMVYVESLVSPYTS